MQRGIWILREGGFYGVQIELCYGILQGLGAWEGVANFAAWSKGGLVYHNMRRLMRNKQKRALG